MFMHPIIHRLANRNNDRHPPRAIVVYTLPGMATEVPNPPSPTRCALCGDRAIAYMAGEYDIPSLGGKGSIPHLGGLCKLHASLLGGKYVTITLEYEDLSSRFDPDDDWSH